MENFPMKIKHIFIGFINSIIKHRQNNYRLNICNKCNNKIKLERIDFCNICGCMINLKTTVKEESCPAHKW